MFKRLIIQPHSDDALFSAAHMMLGGDNGFEVAVLTVENDPKRIKEDKELAELLKIPFFYHLDFEISDFL